MSSCRRGLESSPATKTIDRPALKSRARERLHEIRHRNRIWRADLATFAAEALTIVPKEGEPRKFVFNSVQRELDAALDAQLAETGRVRAIILKARQMGVSTYVGARFYQRRRDNAGRRTLIETHRDDATANLAGMSQRFQEHDPEPPPLAGLNWRNMANGSSITVETAGAVVTGAGVSFTFHLAHLSELPLWQAASQHLAGIMPTFPDAPGSEVIIEGTARGASGPFYDMAMGAMQGIGDYIFLFYPWFRHTAYRTNPPAGWAPPEAFREMGEWHDLDRAQIYWAWRTNAAFALLDKTSPDEISWIFRREYPSTAMDAFRAGRKGGFIPSSIVAAARERLNPHQGDMPLILGCDFATGGGGGDAEALSAKDAKTEGVLGSEDGDANVFISRRGRVMGRECYDRFRDRNTLSVANRLAAAIDRLKPDRVFMDRGGGGAGVFDVLAARGYAQRMELVDFGMAARPVDERRFRNKRAEMTSDFRDWLADGGDIPDDDLLEAEITSEWVISEDERGLTLSSKKLVRQKLGLSPDGADAGKTTFAAPVRRVSRSVIVGGAGR